MPQIISETGLSKATVCNALPSRPSVELGDTIDEQNRQRARYVARRAAFRGLEIRVQSKGRRYAGVLFQRQSSATIPGCTVRWRLVATLSAGFLDVFSRSKLPRTNKVAPSHPPRNLVGLACIILCNPEDRIHASLRLAVLPVAKAIMASPNTRKTNDHLKSDRPILGSCTNPLNGELL